VQTFFLVQPKLPQKVKLKAIHKASFALSHLLEGKKVLALGHKAQRHRHSSWRASDNSRFIVLTSLIKKWRAKNFDVTCDFQFRPIVPKMLTSCPCDDGSSKNVISQSDRSTHASCDVARTVKNDRQHRLLIATAFCF
jgi:hypothetical protein